MKLRGIPEAVWVAVFMVLAQLPVLDRTLVTLDEGQATQIGHRLASGEALYRDIHTGVFPGVYWFVELLFRTFGTEVLVLRWAQLAVNTLIAVSLFVLARPLAPGRAAWLAPIGYWVLVIASFPVFTMLTYSPLSLLAALGALIFCRRYVETARISDGIATGVLLGLSTIIKQNFGGLALLAVLVSALWTRREGRLAHVPTVRAFAVPIAAGLAVAVLAVARLVGSGAWPAFLHATFVSIVGSQMEAFNQPLPPLFGAHPEGGVFYFLYGPGGLFGAMFQGDRLATTTTISAVVRLGYGGAYLALALTPLLARRLAWHPDPRVRTSARIVLPFGALFFLGIFPSAIWSHLAAVYPPLLVVLAAAVALVLARLDRSSVASAKIVRFVGAAVLLVVVALTIRLELGIRRAFAEPLRLPSASVHVAPRDAKLYQASDAFLRECAPEGTPVFVAPYMPLLYVTSGRANATPYDLLISTDVQETVVIDKMQSGGVDCVVYNPQMYVQFAPFAETFPKLSAYLANEFAEVGKVSSGDAEWKFLRRKSVTSSKANL
jgi:4-amino-4-deoxy-L-arabinose transferase-like glycosyltransferase